MVASAPPPDAAPLPSAEPSLPSRPVEPPLVINTDGLLNHNWEWIDLRGRVIVAESPSSPKARTFTKIELPDGAQVTLTYAGPPPGWEGLVDQSIRVVGFLTLCGRLEGGQSLLGSHLAQWETPERLNDEGPLASEEDRKAASDRIMARCLGRDGAAAQTR